MNLLIFAGAIICLCLTAYAVPPEKDRVYDEDLSDVSHHMHDEDHDTDYDHDAFLGKDESLKFKDLTPEESKLRLGQIVDKIDVNGDSKVSHEELKNWIHMQSQRYLREDTEKGWNDYKLEDGKLSFDNYKTKAYDEDDETDAIVRDERRWARADKDGDKLMSKLEFFDFLHPEESEHMRDVVIQETMDEIDKNKDGIVEMGEYIQDMWVSEKGEEEPDWVKTERLQFAEQRDTNRDGVLDKEEIGNWIMPKDQNHVVSETVHLMEQADSDKDGQLTKAEVLDKYDLFVGSQATDFGDALTRHLEL